METLLSERPDHSRAGAPAAAEPPWSAADLRARHPWPVLGDDPRRVELCWHYDLPLAADDVWRVVSDMSRLNRARDMTALRATAHGLTVAVRSPLPAGWSLE